MEKVLDQCAQIDAIAVALYAEYAKKPEASALRSFWLELADEERTHVAAWYWLTKFSGLRSMDGFLDDYDEALLRLKALRENAQELLEQAKGPVTVREMFAATCAIELGMIDVTFVRLFDLFDAINPKEEYRIDYEAHLRRFADIIRETGIVPELVPILDRMFEFWKQNQRIAEQAQHDYLTGLLNRRGFDAIAIPVANLVGRTGGSGGLLMMDMDRFKTVNDTYGHETGDRVLARLGELVRSHMRRSDVAGRFGGEEFTIYLPEVDEEGAKAVAEKIRASVETDPDMPVRVTISVGCVWLTHRGDAAAELEGMLKSADRRLYEAKRNGRNRVESGPAGE